MLITPDARMGLRALTVRQPYAAEIATGHKVEEYRSWPTHYRGDLLITVASAKVRGHPGPYGVTGCIVRLVDVGGQGDDYTWYLEDPRPVAQVAVKGALKLWPVSDDLRAALGLVVAR
jgi:hypothetical protein